MAVKQNLTGGVSRRLDGHWSFGGHEESGEAMRRFAARSTIDRRIVVFFRVDPQAAAGALPPGSAAREIKGCGLAGIAIARRRSVPSTWLPDRFSTFHQAVHFVLAARTPTPRGGSGAVVARSDTSSRLLVWMGEHGLIRLRQQHARFRVVETREAIELVGDSDDRRMHLALKGRVTRWLPRQSVFGSVAQAHDFVRLDLEDLGLIGPETGSGGAGRGARRSRLQPLALERVEASWFDDSPLATAGALEFDSAFWVRDDELAWSPHAAFCCDVATA